MRDALSYVWRVFSTAWRGTFTKAGAAATGGPAALLALLAPNLGFSIAFSDPKLGPVMLFCVLFTAFWLIYFATNLLTAPYKIHREHQQKIADQDTKILALSKAAENNKAVENTQSDAIEIYYSEYSDLCNKVVVGRDGAIVRTIYLRLRNVGNGFLTDCALMLKHTIPELKERTIRVMSPGSPLVAGQHKTPWLVRYTERPPAEPGPDDVMLGFYVGGGFLAGALPAFPAPAAENPLIVTVEATATECASAEASFKIWVDMPAKKLRVELL